MSDNAPDEPIDDADETEPVPRVSPPGIPAEVAAKLAQASAEIDSVPKRGENSYHGYQYATADDVIETAKEALSAVGVWVFPEPMKQEWNTRQTNNGTRSQLTLEMRYTVVDGESGEQWATRWWSQAEDDGDKAYYKAYSQSRKYFLRELLNIPTGEPLDVEFEPAGGGADAGGSADQSGGPPDEVPGIGHGMESRGGGQPDPRADAGPAETHSQPSPPQPTATQQQLTGRIRELLEEAGYDPDRVSEPLAAYVCDRREAEHWWGLTEDDLIGIGQAVAAWSATGGRRSPRRMYVDERIADYLDAPLEDAVDWTATGHDEDDDWQALNGRLRSLVAEVADGDRTKRRFHEAVKVKHGEVGSFNDLTARELMVEIAELQDRDTAPGDDGTMAPRLDYVQGVALEHLPDDQEELDVDDNSGADDDNDGDELGPFERRPTHTEANPNKGKGNGESYGSRGSSQTYFDLDALEESDDHPAGRLVRACRPAPEVSDHRVQVVLRAALEGADADRLAEAGQAVEPWADAAEATAPGRMDGWTKRARGAEQPPAPRPDHAQDAPDIDLDGLEDEGGQIAKIVELCRETDAADGEVAALVSLITEDSDADEPSDVPLTTLSSWLDQAECHVSRRAGWLRACLDEARLTRS